MRGMRLLAAFIFFMAITMGMVQCARKKTAPKKNLKVADEVESTLAVRVEKNSMGQVFYRH